MKSFIVIVLIIVGFISFQHYRQQNEYDKFVRNANLTDGLDALLLLENTIRYYYEDHGEIPSSNEQVRLGAPEDYANRSLRSASILPGGDIELVFKANTGVDGGALRYTPRYAPKVEARMLTWSCETSDYPEITSLECQYIDPNVK